MTTKSTSNKTIDTTHTTTPRESMPKVWRGRRRLLLIQLVGCGIAQAVAALAMALHVDTLLSSASAVPGVDPVHPMPTWGLLTGLLVSVLGIGLIRWVERIVAEDLGQDYVFEQRRRLVTAAFAGAGNQSLGVIVTRASNDLTAVRNWISRGLVPMLTGLPLILVVLLALGLTNLTVSVAVAVPLFAMAALLPWLSGIARVRARKVRRFRGRMSARIADAVKAGDSVVLSGAVRRELNAVDRDSRKVVDAAVRRAYITGLIRSLTVTAASLSTAAVVLMATFGWIDTASVASVMTLLGVMATPLTDLGQVVEYRQNFRAARRIISPVLQRARELRSEESQRESQWDEAALAQPDLAGHPGPGLTVTGMQVDRAGATRSIPELAATDGDRVLVGSTDPVLRRTVLDTVLLTVPNASGRSSELSVQIGGIDYLEAPLRERRNLIGVAAQHLPLERGSVQRLAAYRTPDIHEGEIIWMLRRVGLGPTLDDHSKGARQLLKNDGQPWSSADVARLKVARAFLGTPPVIVLDGVDQDLDDDGLDMLASLVAEHPGVVVLSTANPISLAEKLDSGDASITRTWNIDHRPHVDSPASAHQTARLPVIAERHSP